MKSKKVSTKWVKSSSRINKLRVFFTKTDRFINKFKHSINLKVNGFIKERHLIEKSGQLLLFLCLNVVGTGWLINYIITNRTILSYGLTVAYISFFIDWLVQTIKKPYQQPEQ